MLNILLVIMSIFMAWSGYGQAATDNCSDGWTVTGYYVPYEEDFNGVKQEIITNDGEVRQIKKDFAETVLIEGSGQSEDGEIIEWYWNSWHINTSPEDYFGNELIMGTVAVDPDIIPFYTQLTIPSLPAPFNTRIFTASDIGPSIKNKHIDVFVGYGEKDYKQAWFFPENNRVCLKTVSAQKYDKTGERLSGQILIAVEKDGEAWYVNPKDHKRYYLSRPYDAFMIMSKLGLGISNTDLEKIEIGEINK